MAHAAPKSERKKPDIFAYVLRGCFVIFLLVVCGPFLIASLFVGHYGAYGASCQSNMKQLGLALEQYTQDSDNQLPPLVQPLVNQTWRETLYPYVKSTGVYYCPSDAYRAGQFTEQHLARSYAANRAGWGKIANAHSVIRLVDVRGDDGPDWDMTSPKFAPPSGCHLYTHTPRHLFFEHPNGPVNCLFSDGHVKAMKPMTTLTPVNLWTRDNAPFAGQDLTNAKAILQHTQDE